jgi:cytochrome d ubiquinol oxidase subunit II
VHICRAGQPYCPHDGLGLVAGYALLVATWLIMTTEGKTADRARPTAKALLAAVLFFMAIVSLWTPLAFDRIAARWFSLPNILFVWWVPAVTALARGRRISLRRGQSSPR